MSTYLYALLVSLLFLVVHSIGLYHGLNMMWDPYDIFMHIIGGFVIGLFAYALIRRSSLKLENKRWLIMIIVLIAGILWELFEVYFDIAGHHFGTKLYYIDTAKDLIDDMAGGLLIALLWCKR